MQVFFAFVILTGLVGGFGVLKVQLRPTTAWQKAGLSASMLDLFATSRPSPSRWTLASIARHKYPLILTHSYDGIIIAKI